MRVVSGVVGWGQQDGGALLAGHAEVMRVVPGVVLELYVCFLVKLPCNCHSRGGMACPPWLGTLAVCMRCGFKTGEFAGITQSVVCLCLVQQQCDCTAVDVG